MHYLAILDYSNLDNPLFLKSFAEAARQIKATKAIIIHADSDYTERLIQTGMMREDAQIRSIQDLNHRLISFFADYGLACIGINGFQRGTIKQDSNDSVVINKSYINALPDGTIVVLSNLIQGKDGARQILPLGELAKLAQQTFEPETTHIFSIDSADEIIVNNDNIGNRVTEWSKIFEMGLSPRIPADLIDSGLETILSKPMYNNDLNAFTSITKLK